MNTQLQQKRIPTSKWINKVLTMGDTLEWIKIHGAPVMDISALERKREMEVYRCASDELLNIIDTTLSRWKWAKDQPRIKYGAYGCWIKRHYQIEEGVVGAWSSSSYGFNSLCMTEHHALYAARWLDEKYLKEHWERDPNFDVEAKYDPNLKEVKKPQYD